MRKRLIAVVFLCLFHGFNDKISAQERGVTPAMPPASGGGMGQIRAVVVGISDYQDPGIPDLRFAAADAEEFAAWLRSPAGGALDDDHLQLLTNEKATRAQFSAALDWLMSESREGDEAILYFSGHGDVEKVTKFNVGFLLCYDTPPTNYPAGAFHLSYLQQAVIPTLSESKVKTIVIADACRAGKLAGIGAGGAQATAANLARQFANEIKILSCQPNEYSLEGEQWGGGHGVFSFHLVDGLFGQADNSRDGAVSLLEISRYLQDRVSAEVAPVSQLPMVLGPMGEVVARVDPPALAAHLTERSAKKSGLSSTDVRGLEDEVLAKVESITRERYLNFKAALAEKNFFQPGGADALYRELTQEAALKALHPAMRRNLAAGLQDEVQQSLNALLTDDPYETNYWHFKPEKYADFPAYLQRAIELLGEKHYVYPLLFAQKRYFEAYLLLKKEARVDWGQVREDSVRSTAKALLLEAAENAPDAAYIYHAIGSIYFYNSPFATDSLLKYSAKAIDLSPNWLLPYLQIFTEYRCANYDFDEMYKWLRAAIERKPNSYHLLEQISWLDVGYGRLEESDSLCRVMIAMKPDLFNPWSTMGQSHFGIGDYENAIRFYQKSLALEPGPGNWAWNFYGLAFLNCRREKEGLEHIQKALAQGPREDLDVGLASYFFAADRYQEIMPVLWRLRSEQVNPFAKAISYRLEGAIRLREGKFEAARPLLEKAIETDPTPDVSDCLGRSWLGVLAARQGEFAKADSLFRDALLYPKLGFRWGHEEAHALYGDFLLERNRLAEAQQEYEKARELLPLGYAGWYGLARLAARRGQKTAALDLLEKSLDRWYPRPEPILAEPSSSVSPTTRTPASPTCASPIGMRRHSPTFLLIFPVTATWSGNSSGGPASIYAGMRRQK